MVNENSSDEVNTTVAVPSTPVPRTYMYPRGWILINSNCYLSGVSALPCASLWKRMTKTGRDRTQRS